MIHIDIIFYKIYIYINRLWKLIIVLYEVPTPSLPPLPARVAAKASDGNEPPPVAQPVSDVSCPYLNVDGFVFSLNTVATIIYNIYIYISVLYITSPSNIIIL